MSVRNQSILKLAGVLAAVALAFVLGLLVHGGAAHDAHAGHSHADHNHASPGAAQEYTCPMHPEIRTSDPNERCPICGMALVPVAGDDADEEHPRQITISPRAVALMNVQTVPVQRRAVAPQIRTVGKIDYDETRMAYIAARIPGRIDRLMVDFTGIAVEAGQPMAEIYSPELIGAQEELLQAVQAVRSLPGNGNGALRASFEATLQASRERLRLWGLNTRQIAEIEQTGQVQDHMTIEAPIGGTVVEKNAREGMYVETGQNIYTVADLSQLWVQIDAYETDLQWLRIGQPVQLTTQAHPGDVVEGTISFIAPRVDDRTRTTKVRVELPNPGGRLKPGMFVRATIDVVAENAVSEQPLVIPASAPLITGRRAVAYVQLPDRERPTFEGRDLVLGARVNQHYIVQSGLNEGELVVTNGNFKLDSELQLRGRISMMAPDGSGPAGHDHHHHTTQDAPAAEAEPQPLDAPQAFQQQLGAVVQASFDLMDALADDEPDRSRRAAQQTREALAEVDMAMLEGAAHDVWMSSQRRMDEALRQAEQAEGLEGMRGPFETFSDELTRAVRTFGIADVAPVYRAMCPMVDGRRAYWLQPQRPITNPYWGEAMYRCGEIVETIVEAE